MAEVNHFANPDTLFSNLRCRLSHVATVDIASYSMYLGITEDGKDWHEIYPSAARAFIEDVKFLPHRILIGVPFYIECTPDCQHCKNIYNAKLKRFAITTEHIGLNVRYKSGFHMKYYRVRDYVICGGINLGASDAFDVALPVPKSQHNAMRVLFNGAWDTAVVDVSQFMKE
jgi:hypothetical protein